MTTTGLPHPRLRLRLRSLAVLSLLLPALLLVIPPLAQGRKPSCSSRRHAVHAHACAHGHKVNRTHAAKGHHAVQDLSSAHHPAPATVPASTKGARCEAGSAPSSAADGSACADGSEATCADGSSSASSASATCPAPGEEDAWGGQPTCEEDGAAACSPATEDPLAACREGGSPVPSGQGTSFVCEG